MAILEFILKYWIQVTFGLICAGAGLFHKRVKAWHSAYKQKEADALKNSIIAEVKEALAELSQRSEENDRIGKKERDEIRAGLLTIQGDLFKTKCRDMLMQTDKISLEQFESIQQAHIAYNGLGGNHSGDELFNLVKHKFENQL